MATTDGLAGAASPEGTRRRATRAPGGATGGSALGATGLTVSRLGFGGYRVDDETSAHRAALEAALDAGVNLIDTSTNYTDGGSERLVGAVLRDLVGTGRLGRDEVVVVSKIGYVQGQNLVLAEKREAEGRPFPEMVKYAPGCWHCLHPDFLADQFERSLTRLGLRTLDVCLLHNPEYFFSDAQHRGVGPLADLRDEFYRRLTASFRFFEGEVAGGRLRCYGVSSNTVAQPVGDPEATSLTRILAAAREAGGAGHHFRVLQLPMNLFESGGLLTANCPPDAPAGGRVAVLEAAAREGIGVLLNRPLNASVGRGMLRLADVPVDGAAPSLETALRVVASREEEYRREIASRIQVGEGSPPPETFLRWADQLAGIPARVSTITHWEQLEGQIRGATTHVVRALDDGLSGALAERWRTWLGAYLPRLDDLLGALRREATTESRRQSRAVSGVIDPLLPPDKRDETLSRKALWVLASTPGVSTVLCGMRTRAYVADAVAILGWPPLGTPRSVYEAAGRLAASGA